MVVVREEAVLPVIAEHPRSAVAARHTSICDAIEERAAAEAVVAMHAARDLTRSVEALDRLVALSDDLELPFLSCVMTSYCQEAQRRWPDSNRN